MTFTPPQPKTTPVARKKKWTDTNSDEKCLSDVQNPLNRFLYVLSLKTGFYAIEPTDRKISLVIASFLMIVSVTMGYVFVQGVRDGFQAATTSSSSSMSESLSSSSMTPSDDIPSL